MRAVRLVGRALRVAGVLVTAVALIAGLGAAIYLEGHALLMLVHQDVSKKSEKFVRVFGYPLAAIGAGAVAATLGLSLVYLGDKLTRFRPPGGPNDNGKIDAGRAASGSELRAP